jgi:hypothetical protein
MAQGIALSHKNINMAAAAAAAAAAAGCSHDCTIS